MKVLGIVVEYNPFHNGHLYHLQASRASCRADCVVGVMSGNFTQRGEPAIINKWARTEMALLNGVDLVIELPCAYAMASAEYFAFGAVKLLDSLGAVDTLCFGSESGNIQKLAEVASILADEPILYKQALKTSLASGKSFPAARQEALSNYLNSLLGRDYLSDAITSPNNILGIEYLKALIKLNSKIVPISIERKGSGYHSLELSGEICSATAIRKTLAENNWSDAKQLLACALPKQSLAILEREIELGKGPIFPSDFTIQLISLLRNLSLKEIGTLPYMEEGLENRFKLAAENTGSYLELLDFICTKRYTATRIQRSLFSLLTGLRKDSFKYFNQNGGPSYIRILGFNNTGRKLLSSVKKYASLPIITKSADFKSSDLPGVKAMLTLEADASDQYVLGYKNPALRKAGSEFLQNAIYTVF